MVVTKMSQSGNAASDQVRPARQDRAAVEDSLRAIYDDSPDSGSSADAVHHALHKGIVTGLLPAGWSLREENLAEIFDVSRTPIREALMRLESRKLVERTRRRGLVVSEVTIEQIIEVYAVREALDAIAARLAAQFSTEADIGELEEINNLIAVAYQSGDYQRMARLNVEFHDVVARASRNQMLHEFVQDVHEWVMRFQATTLSHVGRGPEAIAEHREIIDALRRRDALRSEEAARRHIQRSLDARLQMARVRI